MKARLGVAMLITMCDCGDNINPPGPGDVPPIGQCTFSPHITGTVAATARGCPAGDVGLCTCDQTGANYSPYPDDVLNESVTEMCTVNCNGASAFDGCRPGDLTFAFPDCAFVAEVSGIAGGDMTTNGDDHDDTASICPDGPLNGILAMKPDPFLSVQELRDPGSFFALDHVVGAVHAEVQDCRYYRSHDYVIPGPTGALTISNPEIHIGDLVSTAGDWVIDHGHSGFGHAEIHEARISAKTVRAVDDAKIFFLFINAFFSSGTRQESTLALDTNVPKPLPLPTAPPICTVLDEAGTGLNGPDLDVTGCALRSDVKVMSLVGDLNFEGTPFGFCHVELVRDGSFPANDSFCPGTDGPLLYDCTPDNFGAFPGPCCGYHGDIEIGRSSLPPILPGQFSAGDAKCAPIAFAGTVQAIWDDPGNLYICDCDCDDPSSPGATISAPIQGCATASGSDPQAVCDEVCGGVFCSGAAPACEVNTCHAKTVTTATLVAKSVCDVDHQPFVRVGPVGDFRVGVDPVRSWVVFTVGDHTTPQIPVNGSIHFNVSNGTLRIVEFSDVDLRPNNFTFESQSITNAAIVTVERVHGQMFGQSGFEVPAGIGVFAARGTLNGDPVGVNVVNPVAIVGSIDFGQSPARFSIDVAANDVLQGAERSMTAHIEGTVDDLPPHADASRTVTRVECTGPGLTPITLDGTASVDPDPGDRISHYQWFQQANGISNQAIARTSLPLARPTPFTLHVYDSELGSSMSSTTVTVVDTTPPTLTLSPTSECLWPPDHKLVCFELGTDIHVNVADTCDPNPIVKITSVTSNQPADALGGGHTASDFSWTNTQFCVRRERAATLGDRRYTVVVQASDHSGNTTTKDVLVTVPKSQTQGCK